MVSSGGEKPPKTISDTINKLDTFIDPKTGVKASNSKGLAFMKQGKEYSDKGGKGRGGPGCGQLGRGKSITKQDGGGKADSRNKNPSTANDCYNCVNTDHILHFPPDITKNQISDLYLQMKKQTEDKKKAEENPAPIVVTVVPRATK